jgi:uncharacterized protein YjbI with pentapeptide repeats
MQEFVIRRSWPFEHLGDITVQIDAQPGQSASWLLRLAVIAALSASANLSGADLSGANLRSANLRSADLSGADLRSADLRARTSAARTSGARTSAARTSGARTSGARTSVARTSGRGPQERGPQWRGPQWRGPQERGPQERGPQERDLRSADLRSADLRSADLSGADLSGADLRSADLRSADLSGADLRSADLRSADLSGADLRSAENKELACWPGYQIPQEGTLIVWKKLEGGHLAKLQIPAKAQRTATPIGRKCRASEAKVLAILTYAGEPIAKGAKVASTHNHRFTYEVGAVVKPELPYDGSPWVECTSGIHFFLTREEAAAY